MTSSSSTLPRTVPEQENHEDDDAVIAESEEALDTEKFAMVPVCTLSKRVNSNQRIARSDSELRRSTRVSKKNREVSTVYK